MDVLSALLLGGAVFGVVYSCAAIIAVRRFSSEVSDTVAYRPPVTILKPLCGNEPELLDNLRSFCEQDYPEFQIVFGVRERSDPSVAVVEKLIADMPEADLTLVYGGSVDGANHKVCSLHNTLQHAKHDVVLIADSDIRVHPDYLGKVVAPLADPRVGMVTCLYTGRALGNLWSRLGAAWINHGFLPSVLFSRMLGTQPGCFGATMAFRRACLDKIGGFVLARDLLADDYALGWAVREAGYRLVVSSYLVDSLIAETDFRRLYLRELRWGRTIRSISPLGYTASVITNPVPLAALGTALAAFSPTSLAILGLALAVRLGMTREIDRLLRIGPTPLWLVPLRDGLSLYVMVASYFGSRVVWRDRSLRVVSGGRLIAENRL